MHTCFFRFRSCVRPLLACVFGLSAASLAADSGLTPLTTASTDGRTYPATFAAGLSLNDGQTFRTTATTADKVLITGSIKPDPAHVGKKGDLYIVELVGDAFYMRTTAGNFVPWNFAIPDLVPAHEDVTLAPSHTVEIFKGAITVAGDHHIFLGYQPASGAGLIYTPVPLSLTINHNMDAQSVFENTVFDSIVMTKCTLCHVKGGVADGRTDLLFVKDANLGKQNFDLFKAFFNKRTNAYDYVLSKVSGGDRHVGGTQLAAGSADYNTMANFLAVLEGRTPGASTPSATGSFFNGVTLQSNLKTLRRAAIMLTGRLPTAAEQSAVASGDDNTLRSTLRNMMQGATFHDWVKDAANDRLLVRGLTSAVLDDCFQCFPNHSDNWHALQVTAFNTGDTFEQWRYFDRLNAGLQEAPLELVARVVENDLPYSEVLLADYTMLNGVTNQPVGGTATPVADSSTDFQPGRITAYYRQDNSVIIQKETRFNHDIIVNRGNLRSDIPHVGVLNDLAFLARYPSTATNRNRARARWTFFHFLGVDIEQSAQRTTDALALADTHNPTLNNPNCTVCHATMDPVAGAFQDYGDNGFYKETWGGRDALDQNYKFPPDRGPTLYVQGDTWYRDMRAPGFNQLTTTDPNSLRWLAQQIVADERFASAAVRFWWPAVIGRELLKRPEVATDADYQARLMAFDAQEATIAALATKFRQSGLKVKSLLVDMLMSEWFRAQSIDTTQATEAQLQAHLVAGLGNEKLLTPEQLARKTWVLTGFNWASIRDNHENVIVPGLVENYGLYYGGIDSNGVTRRTRDMTPLMSTVALSMALESSCPIVYGEFVLPDAQRLLFGGISELLTPVSEGGRLQTVDSTTVEDVKSFTLDVGLGTGPKRVAVSYTNELCDWDPVARICKAGNRDLFISSISLRRPNGSTVEVPASQLKLASTSCGGMHNTNRLILWDECTAYYEFTAEQSGTYTLTARLSAVQAGSELVKANLTFEHNGPAAQSTAQGAVTIRNKLVDLHQILLGQTLAANSPEISAAFELLADTWQARQETSEYKHLMREGSSCDPFNDIGFMSYLGYPGNPVELYKNSLSQRWYRYADPKAISAWLQPKGTDPVEMKQSWQVVLTYLLSHYNYLYE